MKGFEMTIDRAPGFVLVPVRTEPERERLLRAATLPNPAFARLQRLGRWTGRTPRTLCYARPLSGGVELPIGLARVLGLADTRPIVAPPARLRVIGEGLRPYQRDAVAAALAAGSGIVVAPCGSGKTRIGCALIAAASRETMVLVHTAELAAQWQAALLEHTAAPIEVLAAGRWSTVRSGAQATGRAGVRLVMVQSAMDRGGVPRWRARGSVELLIVDECHHQAASTYAAIVGACGAPHRYGLTATPEREDGLGKAVQWHLGPVCATIDAAELIDAGHSVVPVYRTVQTDWRYPHAPGEALHELLAAMVASQERNATIVWLAQAAADEGRAVLVLTGRVAHAHALAEMMVAEAMTSRTRGTERARIVERMRSGEPMIVCATSLADEGLDWPACSCLILATPSRAAGRTVQRVGRTMRPAPGAPAPVVYDLVDDIGALRGQHVARRRALRGIVAMGGVS